MGVVVQLALLATGSALALAPPIEGVMLVAPMLPGGADTTIGWTRDTGALLIRRGPYAGSYFVRGSLVALLLPAVSHGALLLDARIAGCGPLDRDER